MKDAERIIDRILFLEGVPNMQRLGAVTIGESVPEQLQIQLEGERQALKVLADGIKVSLEEGDDASREFFAGSLLEEEEHADWLETVLTSPSVSAASDGTGCTCPCQRRPGAPVGSARARWPLS